MPAQARAAEPGISGPASCPAIFTWCVFMAVFLFTIVNTQYEACLVLYPDFASDFACIFLIFLKEWYHRGSRIGEMVLLETKV
jgi:hypothetical protein